MGCTFMKVTILSLLAAGFILGSGLSASAQGMCPENMNFGQMKEMHPELSTKELQEKYKECHETLGSEKSKNFTMDCKNHN
jgi:hypothetical protein